MITIKKLNTQSLDASLNLLLNEKVFNFNESIEAHFNLYTLNKASNKNLSGLKLSLQFPKQFGKKKTIGIFSANPLNLINSYNNINTKFIGINDISDYVNKKPLDFDILITNIENFNLLVPYAKFFGTKGLMPSLKNGTIYKNLEKTLEEYNLGRFDIKIDKYGILHTLIGNIKLDINDLKENFQYLVNILKNYRFLNNSRLFIKSVYLTTTMGKAYQIHIN